MEKQEQGGFGRREFLGAAAAALFAGVVIQITGCSTDSGSSGPTLEAGDKQGSILDNHGHKAIIKKAQLDAGGAVTLDIQGSADHTHNLELTADDMATLKAGQHVMKATSTTNSHSHIIMFN
jgi:hypothetical protein